MNVITALGQQAAPGGSPVPAQKAQAQTAPAQAQAQVVGVSVSASGRVGVEASEASGVVGLDVAGRGRMPVSVRGLVAECVGREEGEGPHALVEEFEDVLQREVYRRLGALLGVPAGAVVLVEGGDAAFAAVVGRLRVGRRARVWTTPFESVARLSALMALRTRTGCRLETVPLSAEGDLDLEWMARQLDEDVVLVSVPHVPAGCGTVLEVEAVGRLLAGHGCLYAVDGARSVGQFPVDVAAVGCDVFTGDGWRFLRGPEQVGFAVLSARARALLTTPTPATAAGPASGFASGPAPGFGLSGVSGGSWAAGVLGPVPRPAAVVGLNAALALHASSAAGSAAGVGDGGGLWMRLRAAVEGVAGVEVVAPGRVQCGIVTFRHPGLPAAVIRRELAARGVVVRKTVAQEMPLYLPQRGITTAVRVSVHPTHTARDIARFARALHDVVRTANPRPPATPHPAASRPAVAAEGPAAVATGPAGVVAGGLPVRPRPAGSRRHLTLLPGLGPAPAPHTRPHPHS